MCRIILLDFVRLLNYKITDFENWILLPSPNKKKEGRKKTYLLGTLVELASDLEVQNPVPKQPQSTFIPQCETKFHTHIKQQVKSLF
jgi:hypothetical protein